MALLAARPTAPYQTGFFPLSARGFWGLFFARDWLRPRTRGLGIRPFRCRLGSIATMLRHLPCNVRCCLQNVKQPAHFHMAFQRVSQMQPGFYPVMVMTSHTLPIEVSPPFEIHDDSLHSPLGNAHFRRNVSNSDVGPDRDAEKDMGMVAQKGPNRRLNWIHHVITPFVSRGGRIPFVRTLTPLVVNNNLRKAFRQYILRNCCRQTFAHSPPTVCLLTPT